MTNNIITIPSLNRICSPRKEHSLNLMLESAAKLLQPLERATTMKWLVDSKDFCETIETSLKEICLSTSIILAYVKKQNLPNDSTILNTSPSSTSWMFSSMVISNTGTSGRSYKMYNNNNYYYIFVAIYNHVT